MLLKELKPEKTIYIQTDKTIEEVMKIIAINTEKIWKNRKGFNQYYSKNGLYFMGDVGIKDFEIYRACGRNPYVDQGGSPILKGYVLNYDNKTIITVLRGDWFSYRESFFIWVAISTLGLISKPKLIVMYLILLVIAYYSCRYGVRKRMRDIEKLREIVNGKFIERPFAKNFKFNYP